MQNIENIIFSWNMNQKEALAYRIGWFFIEKSRKLIPDYFNVKYPKKGDPRDSILFRTCYKLVRETQGKLENDEYEKYVYAQIFILKNIKDKKDIHSLIDPSCLVGDKAWSRWKVYLKKEKIALSSVNQRDQDSNNNISLDYLKSDLFRTKRYLNKKFDNFSKEILRSIIKNKEIKEMLSRNFVSPYFLVLSPWVLLDKEIDISYLNLSNYSKYRSEKMINIFKEIFPEQFT